VSRSDTIDRGRLWFQTYSEIKSLRKLSSGLFNTRISSSENSVARFPNDIRLDAPLTVFCSARWLASQRCSTIVDTPLTVLRLTCCSANVAPLSLLLRSACCSADSAPFSSMLYPARCSTHGAPPSMMFRCWLSAQLNAPLMVLRSALILQ
jgi:hypothetical protein